MNLRHSHVRIGNKSERNKRTSGTRAGQGDGTRARDKGTGSLSHVPHEWRRHKNMIKKTIILFLIGIMLVTTGCLKDIDREKTSETVKSETSDIDVENVDEAINTDEVINTDDTKNTETTSTENTNQDMVSAPSLGGISLGDSPERVIEVLGSNYTESVEPDTAGFIGEDMILWSYENDAVIYFGQTSGKVLKVTTASRDLKTDLGIKAGDNAETVFNAYRPLYDEPTSRHSNDLLEGWFLMEDGVVIIFDFNKSDGSAINSDVTPDSVVEEIILAYWKHFD